MEYTYDGKELINGFVNSNIKISSSYKDTIDSLKENTHSEYGIVNSIDNLYRQMCKDIKKLYNKIHVPRASFAIGKQFIADVKNSGLSDHQKREITSNIKTDLYDKYIQPYFMGEYRKYPDNGKNIDDAKIEMYIAYDLHFKNYDPEKSAPTTFFNLYERHAMQISRTENSNLNFTDTYRADKIKSVKDKHDNHGEEVTDRIIATETGLTIKNIKENEHYTFLMGGNLDSFDRTAASDDEHSRDIMLGSADTPEEEFVASEAENTLKGILKSTLSENDYKVTMDIWDYEMSGDDERRAVIETAKDFGITKNAVREIYNRSMVAILQDPAIADVFPGKSKDEINDAMEGYQNNLDEMATKERERKDRRNAKRRENKALKREKER